MSVPVIPGLNVLALLGVLALSPFGGCDGSSSPGPINDPISGPGPTGGSGEPRGGTPEPGTMLLVGGSAAGYLALRRRKKRLPVADEDVSGA